MPRTPDASMVTRVIKASANVNTDPDKKSRTYDAPLRSGYLSAQLRASEVQRYRSGSILGVATWRAPQIQRTRFLGNGPTPTSAVFIYSSSSASNQDPGNGNFAVGVVDSIFYISISSVDSSGNNASGFLDAIAGATTINVTSPGKLLVLSIVNRVSVGVFRVTLTTFSGGYPSTGQPSTITYA